MRGSEVFASQVCDPILELVMRRHYEAALIAIEGVKMVNLALQPSQYLGGSGGSRPYSRKMASRNSCAPSSFPFAVDG